MLKPICLAVAVLLGIMAILNSAFMLVSPAEWYVVVPGVTTTGPFNQHFIRDIGLIYLFIGTSLLTGAMQPRFRVLLWLMPTLWLTSHAFFHFWEVAVGICGPADLVRDFPALTMPAIIGALLTLWAFYNPSACLQGDVACSGDAGVGHQKSQPSPGRLT
ncbi:hypothetical protein [Afipia sp. Root123D2]|uniref:hypothetical protein n=1 Tax=Afipia sp. Root123D2 TaxID=1736436 RepID=UPI000A471F05|nr:hypothetical protein [Afipia sp. Root123D2]